MQTDHAKTYPIFWGHGKQDQVVKSVSFRLLLLDASLTKSAGTPGAK